MSMRMSNNSKLIGTVTVSWRNCETDFVIDLDNGLGKVDRQKIERNRKKGGER